MGCHATPLLFQWGGKGASIRWVWSWLSENADAFGKIHRFSPEQIYNSLSYCGLRSSTRTKNNQMPRSKNFVRRPPIVRYARASYLVAQKIARKSAFISPYSLAQNSTALVPKIKKIRKLTLASRKSVRIAALPQPKPTPQIVLPAKKVANKKKAKKKIQEAEYLPKKAVKLLNELVIFNKSLSKKLANLNSGRDSGNQTSAQLAEERVTRSNSIVSKRTRSSKLNNSRTDPKSIPKSAQKKVRDNSQIGKKKVGTSRNSRSISKGNEKTMKMLPEQVKIEIKIPQLPLQLKKASVQKSKPHPTKRKSSKRKTLFSRKKKTAPSQILFIINKQRLSHEWQFKTLGKASKISNTFISMKSHCDCSEYSSKNNSCQHLRFFFKSVADLPILLEEHNEKKELVEESYHVLDDALKKRLFERHGKAELKFDSKEHFQKETDGKCIICFNLLNKNTEDNEECRKCCAIFHSSCFEIWKRYHSGCAICQNPLQIEQQMVEPIKEFQELTL